MKVVSQASSSTSTITPWPRWRTRLAALKVVALLLLLLVTASVALLARQILPGYTLDLTVPEPDARLNLIGFHGLERNAEFDYRWSSGYAFMQLPSGYHAAPRYWASVRLRASHPQAPQPLTFLSNEQALATVTPGTAFRTYRFLLSHNTGSDGALRFALMTPPFSPPGDVRELGVIVTGMTLQPIAYRDGMVALLLPLALIVVWGALRWRGATARAALLICSVMAAALLALYGLYRPAPLQYSWLALLAVAASVIAMFLASETAERLGLALLAALVSFSGVLWPGWFSDDAFISFQYARNLVAGHGLVYNVGERVEGYTNFLWTMLSALVLYLGGDPVFWAYVAGVALALAIMLLTYWLARRLLGPAWALVATLIVATSQSLLIHTARGAGLETGLFALLALASSALYLQSRYGERPGYALLSGVGFALATLTRPEGALLLALTLLHMLFATVGSQGLVERSPSPSLRLIASSPHRSLVFLIARRWSYVIIPYLLIVLPYFMWRVGYYGDLLPNTFYAKTGGGLRQALRGLSYAWGFALTLGGPLLLVICIPFLANWRAAVTSWRGYLLLLLGVYSAYIVAVGGDHFRGDRFFVPLVAWFAIMLADGFKWLYARGRQHLVVRPMAPAILAVGLLVFSAYALTRSASYDVILRGQDESVWIWREIGWWLRDHAAPDESIAATGAGAIAYYSDHTTIDLLGLTEKHIARVEIETMGSGPAGHEKRDPTYVLSIRRPTYIPRMWDDYFGGEQVLKQNYTLIQIHTRYGRQMELWKRLP